MATNVHTDGATQFVDSEISAIKAKTDNLPSDPADESALESAIATAQGDITDIKTQTDKLNGELEAQGATTANWQSGTGTSGEAGADLCTIGSDGVRKKLLSFLISLHDLTAGANITVKMFMQINGTERKLPVKTFVIGTDTPGQWIIDKAVGIHRAIRVEVQSDNASDNGKSIGYDFMTEVM